MQMSNVNPPVTVTVRHEEVTEALREYAKRRRIRRLLEYRGKAHWEGDLDALRGRERR